MTHKLLTWGGLLLLAAALFLGCRNVWEQEQAAQAAHSAAVQLQEAIPPPPPVPEADPPDTAQNTSQESDIPVLPIDGNDYIGLLEIPVLELSLPILADWSNAHLKIAPCRYLGTAETGDLIIAGHNYKSHFGGLSRLQAGDEVRFLDVQGNVFSYTVSKIETIPGSGVAEMEAGDWDLTLFTCTPGGKNRVTVRCQAANPDNKL